MIRGYSCGAADVPQSPVSVDQLRPLGDVLAFVADETIKPYLAAKGHAPADVEKIHLAWCKSMQLQLALWIGVYAETGDNR